ncbi:MAG: hypothetical protein FalmKO_35730 [Falsiruegeria mediterranea]
MDLKAGVQKFQPNRTEVVPLVGDQRDTFVTHIMAEDANMGAFVQVLALTAAARAYISRLAAGRAGDEPLVPGGPWSADRCRYATARAADAAGCRVPRCTACATVSSQKRSMRTCRS